MSGSEADTESTNSVEPISPVASIEGSEDAPGGGRVSSETVEQTLPFGSVRVDVSITPPPPPPPPRFVAEKAKVSIDSLTETGPNSKTGSKWPIIIGALVIAILGVVVWSFVVDTDNDPPPQAVLPASPTKDPKNSTNAGDTSLKQTANSGVSSKDMLNILLGLARDNRWEEIPPKVVSLKSITTVNVGNRHESNALLERGLQDLSNDPQASELMLMRAVNADPSNEKARFELIRSLLAQRKFDEARLALVDTLSIAPDKGQGWLLAAQIFTESPKAGDETGDSAISALKLAVFYANNRQIALETLQNAKNTIQSEKLVIAIQSSLPTLMGVPERQFLK
jgi:hypothetical protein